MNEETSMSEKSASHAQQYADGWKRMWEDGLARIGLAQEQGARFETQIVDNLSAAVDQSAVLAKQTLNYAAQLSAEWRKQSYDAARRMSDLFANRA
jgi:hypothetical protein